jgi:hypothetical protein
MNLSMIAKPIYWLRRYRSQYKRTGLIKTLKYILVNGPQKRVAAYFNYLSKKDRYPQNIIFLVSLGKSGSTWLYHMFGSLNGFNTFCPYKWNTVIPTSWEYSPWDLYPGIFDEYRHRLAVIRSHTRAKPENLRLLAESGLKYFITVRDPRDVVISTYWYHRNTPAAHEHELLQKLSLEEYITNRLESGMLEKYTLDWIRSWLDNQDEDRAHVIRYEDLLADTHGVLRQATEFLGFECGEQELSRIVEENRFERVSGRKPGQEAVTSFQRKGVTGEWREIFTDEHKQMFAHIGEDVLVRLGYKPTL